MSVVEKIAARVLVIDDNVELAKRASMYLTEAGHEVRAVYSGAEGLRVAFEFQPDLVVLDVMMEGMDGWEVCSRLRACSNTVILFATAKIGEVDIVRGLDLGADGYITKDYSMAELEAHIQAALRRARGIVESDDDIVRTDGHLKIDFAHNQVSLDGKPIRMSPKEYQILAHLVMAEGHPVPYQELLGGIWGEDYRSDSTYLAIYVSRVRQKIERDSHDPKYILTHHRVGYEFRWQPDESVSTSG